MLCCGKRSKKKVKGESAISHTNSGFVGDQEIKGDEKSGELGVNSSVVKEPGMGDNVTGKDSDGPSPGAKKRSLERLKSILQTDDKLETDKRIETGRRRRRSVSFSLPEEDLPVLNKDQLTMFGEVDKIHEEEEEELKKKEGRYPFTADAASTAKGEDLVVEEGKEVDEEVELVLVDNSRELTLIEGESSESDEDTLTESDKPTMSNQVPAIAKLAPIFEGTAVVDGQFKDISLRDYKGKYVVFFFYPMDFTFVCPTEIIAFSDRVQEFRKIGCEVIACSTDSHFSHLAWVNTPRKTGGLGEMKIPLLADKSMAIARAYGVLKEDEGIAFRGLFVIDDKANLRQATINDLPVGRDVDETLRLVQAFQFTDKHGEVCPAGWKPGAKSMKADPSGSKEYFQSEN